MSTAETTLPENASPDEIGEVVSDLLGITEGGDEPAAEPADDDTHEPSPGVEEPAEEEPAAESGEEAEGEVAAEGESTEGESTDWIDDDVRGLASALAISDEQLSMFTSRDELDKALTLLDSHVMRGGVSPATQDPEPTEAREEQHAGDPNRRPDGTFLPAGQRKPASPVPFKVDLDPENMTGEDIAGQFGKLHQHYEGVIQGLAERVERTERTEYERAAEVYAQQFDAAVDVMANPELFGETGRETPEQTENRQLLLTEFEMRRERYGKNGREVKLNGPLLSRLSRMLFSAHFHKQQRKNLTRKVSRQAGVKAGEPVSRSPDPVQSFEEEMKEEYDRLEAQDG